MNIDQLRSDAADLLSRRSILTTGDPAWERVFSCAEFVLAHASQPVGTYKCGCPVRTTQVIRAFCETHCEPRAMEGKE